MMGYKKPAGVYAQAQIAVRMDDSGNARLSDVTLSGTGLLAHGTAHFDADGDLQSLVVPSFHAGTTNDYSLTLTQSPGQGSEVTISGRSFDETVLLHRETGADRVDAAPKSEQPAQAYHIIAKLDRVVMRDGVVLAPLAADVTGVGNTPHTLMLNATQSKTAQLTAGIVNGENGRHVTLSAGDAGLLLKGLFGFTSLKGGTLNIEAALPVVAKGDPNQPDYTGTLTLNNFTIVNQPFLARLFSAGSFGGLSDLIRGQGIVFDKFDAPFSLHGDALTIHEARAAGPSVGITVDGYYDSRTNQLGLQGAIAPLYGINSVLGAIPVLGNVFVSKKGEGIFGVTYSVSGNGDQPSLTVNPLAILAPGILRRVFQGATPSATPVQANSSPPAPVEKPQ
jgi:hypothetical protein